MAGQSDSDKTPSQKRIPIAPRQLPEENEQVPPTEATPFEQLNDEVEDSANRVAASHGIIRPRELPETELFEGLSSNEAQAVETALRMVQGGHDRDTVARQLDIEPLQLRRWEAAYHEHMQTDINDGSGLHDSDSQLRIVSEEEKQKFSENFDVSYAGISERKVKVSPVAGFLRSTPLTRWMVSSKNGKLDLGAIFGFACVLGAVLLGGLYLLRDDPAKRVKEEGMDIPRPSGPIYRPDAIRALNFAMKFLQTEDIEEKLDMVRGREHVEPLMRKYYAENPGIYDEFEIDPRAATHKLVYGKVFFLVGMIAKNSVSGDAKQYNFALEKVGNNYLIDWEVSFTYQGYPEGLSFREYLDTRPPEPLEFRVLVAKADYYNFRFSDPSSHFCFKLTDAMDKDVYCYAYAKKTLKEGHQLNQFLEDFKEQSGNIVKIQFPVSEGNQVELLDWVSDSFFRKFGT